MNIGVGKNKIHLNATRETNKQLTDVDDVGGIRLALTSILL